jgi:hypothetical protein
MIHNPPGWLEEWSRQIGAELKDGLRENPSWIAFARENGTVYPHLHGVGARPVRRAVLQLPARTNAESPTRRTRRLAEGRIPGLTRWRIAPRLVVLVDPPWPPPTSIGAQQSSAASAQDPPQPSNGGLRPSASTQ